MMTINDKYKEFTDSCGDAGEKLFVYSVIRSNLNMLEEGAYELDDAEVTEQFRVLIMLVDSRCKAILNTEVQVDKTMLQVAVEDVDKLRYALEHVQLTGDDDVDDTLCALCDRLG